MSDFELQIIKKTKIIIRMLSSNHIPNIKLDITALISSTKKCEHMMIEFVGLGLINICHDHCDRMTFNIDFWLESKSFSISNLQLWLFFVFTTIGKLWFLTYFWLGFLSIKTWSGHKNRLKLDAGIFSIISLNKKDEVKIYKICWLLTLLRLWNS